MAPAGLIFVFFWWRQGRPYWPLIRFLTPLGLCAAALLVLNDLRFNDPFEFGHRYLDIRWQTRIQDTGLFSTAYLSRNLHCLLGIAPQLDPLRISIHGIGLLLSTPWVLLALRPPQDRLKSLVLLGSASLIAIPALLYHNSGQLQFAYRFALDWLLLLVIALGINHSFRSNWSRALIVISCVIQLYGAWFFVRSPAQLFVHDPLGWPYEREFKN